MYIPFCYIYNKFKNIDINYTERILISGSTIGDELSTATVIN